MGADDATKNLRLVFALFLIVLPVFIFYFILYRTAVNLPILDDYEIILGTTNWLHQTPGFLHRLAVVLVSEHNGYKLMFENSVVWTVNSILGRVNILPLVVIGNIFPIFIFLIVMLMAKNIAAEATTRLLLIAPVAYLLFQLQYASALNFASSSLQHLAVIAFSLHTIYLLSRKAQSALAVACIAFIAAIACSPNGFFVAPIGVLMLAQEKRWKWMAYWMAVCIGLLCFYLFRYHSAPTAVGSKTAIAFSYLSPLYSISFLGASAARYSSVFPAVLLGLLLCCIFGVMVARRYYLQNPAIVYSIVFILINAVAVAGVRTDSGIAQSLASRYRIYSNLMLAFSYLFLVETALPRWKSARARSAFVAAALIISAAFCFLSDIAGSHFLAQKKLALTENYEREWLGEGSRSVGKIDLNVNPALKRQMESGVYDVNLPILRESVRLGVYQPPRQP
jgi:hypothetical protein